uniref:GK21723 n=2 Tax=Drosophila willistoni TaxID=7260 RepID=B4MPL4_DROWI
MDYFPFPQWGDISNKTTPMADIFVFIDTYWPYYWVVDYVAYVLQNLNIHPYGSRVTIYAASDASIIVNTTDYIINVYQQWNATSHSWHPTGLNLPLILNTVSNEVEDILAADQAANNLGGRSLVALLIPSPVSFVDERDYDYCQGYLDRMSRRLPNLQFIYYGGGALVRFHDFVTNPSEDLFLMNLEQPPEKSGDPVITRIRQVPRRISNPRCDSSGYISEYGMNSLEQFGRLGSINFYRLEAFYMPRRKSMRYLEITPNSNVAFTVCFSRKIALTFRNETSRYRLDETCESTALGALSYDLTDACMDYDWEPCPPLYFSVQSQSFGDVSCTQPECQTPDEAQYTLSLNNLGCSSASVLEIASLGMILLVMVGGLFFG